MICFFRDTFHIQANRHGSEKMQYVATTELAPDGRNLTTVIATLFQNFHDDIFLEIERFMRSVFPEIQRIRAPAEGGTPIMFTEVFLYDDTSGSSPVPLAECGAGIEQMLMLATAIYTANGPRLFLIDEPHAFLHLSAERSLLQLFRKHPEHQYIVATHSPLIINSVATAQNRLITKGGEGSHITDVKHVTSILDAIGLTAADLGITDVMLWIEGQSDAEVAEEVLAYFPELQQFTWRVRPMPNWVRGTHASVGKAKQMMEFCDRLLKDIWPVRIPSFFLFDGDETAQSQKEEFKKETGGRARLLPVREIENLFLSPGAIHAVLSGLCSDPQVGKTLPTLQEVTERLQALLNDTSNKKLYNYKVVPSGPDESLVIGSYVLERLWWEFAESQYDKVAYARILTKEVIKLQPEKLEPLRTLLEEWTALVLQSRGAE